MYKNLFWYISRKIGKILENFQKVPFKALLKQEKIFSKRLTVEKIEQPQGINMKHTCTTLNLPTLIPGI